MRKWEANPGAQTRFLASTAYEALYGGAAGGGKSISLLMSALRHASQPTYRALLLRRTFPELTRSLIEVSRGMYPMAGGTYNEGRKQWRFPSGALIEFGHLENDAAVHDYQSAEFAFIGWDELTSFTERMYVYMLSRARSSTGLPVQIRAATNPGGIGHEWVMRRWGPWLDPDSTVTADPGQTLHYRTTDDGDVWCDKAPGTLSRVFIPARIADNPHLTNNDPDYATRLGGLDPVTRAQLRDGNWLVKPAAGLYFKRGWFTLVDKGPGEARRCRYWDRAASEQGDWTVGMLLARDHDGLFYIEHMVRFRGRPAEVEARIRATAEADGHGVSIGIEEDPGQAGKFESAYYVKALAGYHVRVVRPTGDKVTRALPASAQCERGNVRLVRGDWNVALLDELEAFPEGAHDDVVDALSGAFSVLSRGIVSLGEAPVLSGLSRTTASAMAPGGYDNDDRSEIEEDERGWTAVRGSTPWGWQ